MPINPLVLQNKLYSAMFSSSAVDERFSTGRSITDFLAFEIALLEAQAETGLVDVQAKSAGVKALETFQIDLDAFKTAMIQDGLPVPEFVRQLKAHVGPELAKVVHFEVASQDLIDTNMSLAIRDVNAILLERLNTLRQIIKGLSDRFDTQPLTARTRMQAALVGTVGDRIDIWRRVLDEAETALRSVQPQIETLQLGGAIGTYQTRDDAQDHLRFMAEKLGLSAPTGVWHAARGRVATYANVLSLITGALGKIGQDIALMSQQGLGTIKMSGGGSSSAMPHKQNPVIAETLVAFARYNAGQVGVLHQSLVHEQERSGAAWVVEWMTLPAMLATTSRSLDLGCDLLQSITDIGDPTQT